MGLFSTERLKASTHVMTPPVSTHATTTGVMIYEGRPYAVGLLWFTVQEDTEKSLLSQRVKKTHADFYTLRAHISQQHGFGWLDKGHRRGMAAAAAMVADQLVGEWHGVFEADNGWWYVQVRSDTVTPNGDRFFTSEEEAFHLFQEEMQKNVWPHTYAPEKWRLADSHIRELSLKNLLDDFTTSTLTPTNVTAMFGSAATRNIVLGGLIAAFALMALIMSFTYLGNLGAQAVVESTAPVRTVQKPKTPPRQPLKIVSPPQFLQQCGQAAEQLYQALPGWMATEFNCRKGTASFAWQQAGGTLRAAREAGAPHWPANTTINLNNRIMIVTMKLDDLPTIVDPILIGQDRALMYLEQKLQPLGALKLKPVTPVTPPAPARSAFGGAPLPPPPPPSPYLEIELLSGFGPEKIASLLTEPGLELEHVQWKLKSAVWQYKLKWTHLSAAAAAMQKASPSGENK